MSPDHPSILSPAVTATSQSHYSMMSPIHKVTSPVQFSAASPTPSDPFTDPVFYPGSPPTSEAHNTVASPSEEGETAREVDAGSVHPSVYRDVEDTYGNTLQERAAAEPLPPAYDTLPARRPVVNVRTDLP